MEYRVKRCTQSGDNELYHWKYIDKVKTKTGKWRYIYDEVKDALSDEDERQALEDARIENARAEERKAYTAELFLKTEPNTKERDKAYERYKKEWNNYLSTDRKVDDAEYEYDRASTMRGKMSELSKIFSREINVGKRYIQDLFD